MPRQIWQIASALGLAASMLSLASLVFQGFQVGLSAPIGAMLAYYNGLLDFLFGWAEPPLKQLAHIVAQHLALPFHVSPDWKHVFVLMWLYFSTDARSSFLQHRPITAIATLIVGALVAIAAAAVSGGASSAGLTDILLALSIPLVGFVLHALIESGLTVAFYRQPNSSLAHAIRYYLKTEVLSALLASAAAVATAAIAVPLGTSRAVIAGLAVFLLVRGAYWLLRGLYIGFTDRAPGESRLRRFARSGSGQFGMLIFSVFLGTLLFVALNAGLTT